MCFAAVGGLVLSSADESRTRDAVASKKRSSTLRRRLLRDAATRSAVICGSVRSGQFAKVQNRTARKPYIENKEGLEEGIPNLICFGEGSVSAMTIKWVCSASGRGRFERINARGAWLIGAKQALQPSINDRATLWLRRRRPRRFQRLEFKSSIADRAAARQR